MRDIIDDCFNVGCSLVLDTRYTLKDGRHNVSVQLYKDGQYYYHKTGLKLKNWNEISEYEKEIVTKKYEDIKSIVKNLVKNNIFSFSEFKDRMNKPFSTTINGYMEQKILEFRKKNQFSTAGHYTSALRLFTKQCGEVSFSDLTPAVLSKLLDYMTEIVDGEQRYSNATIEIYFQDLKTTINDAIYDGLMDEAKYPFRRNQRETSKVIVPKSESRMDNFLTKEEMIRVYNYYKRTKDPYIGLFLFSYLSGGMNLADVLRLKWNRHYFDTGKREFRYIRTKTIRKNKDFMIRVPIIDEMKEILDNEEPVLDEYVFPYLRGTEGDPVAERAVLNNTSQAVNAHLKSMCKKIKLDKPVTPTYARHSFSTVQYQNEVPTTFVEYMLGHKLPGSGSNYFGGYTTDALYKYNSKLLKISA